MSALEKIQELINNKEYESAISLIVKEFRLNTFSKNWNEKISDSAEREDIRINSLVIGKIGDLQERIYVGANADRVFIFDLNGGYLGDIELEEGVEVLKLQISNVTYNNSVGDELIIHTSNDAIIFYGHTARKGYQKLQYQINYSTTSITSFFALELPDESIPVYVGDSSGDVVITTYDNLKLDIDDVPVIAESVKITGEIIAGIYCSNDMINGEFGLLIGYKNGVLLLFNSTHELIGKYDVDKEIEGIYFNEKTNNIIIATDDYYIYHFSVIDNNLINNWHYYVSSAASIVVNNTIENNEAEFFVLSEDNGTILAFNRSGKLVTSADPSFEGTAGCFHNGKLILSSREGEICEFNILEQEKLDKLWELLYIAFNAVLEQKNDNDFYEFFNTEFESAERADFFKEFLIEYFNKNEDGHSIDKIITLFEKRRYNSDIAEGLISKIISNSILKNSFLRIFKDTAALSQIVNFQNLIDTNKNATNLIKKAEGFLKVDPLKYIELMSEIRVQKLDKIWVAKLFEDDDVVSINYYHNPYEFGEQQIVIATRKGKVFLIDRKSGQLIWNFNLEIGDGQITNVEIADVSNNGLLEIVIGLENAQNSILILSANKDQFNAANNEVELKWKNVDASNDKFKLYISRCRISGMDFNAVHKVHCFDFDNNGVHDLMISSENGRFDVFYFDNERKDRIIPKTKSIDYNDEDVLVFELYRDENDKIVLYTGSALGNIQKHVYDGKEFIKTEDSFTERDAKITDILIAEINNERVVLFSSEDNFLYCLSSDLDYKWSFKTRGDVKSISVTEFANQQIILTISDDGYLYALDTTGNKLWDYPFFSPLDKLFVNKNEVIVADSDGNIISLTIENSDDIIKRMDADLADIKIDIESLLENESKYLRVFAVRKLLSLNPSDSILNKIIMLLNDAFEFEELVRCETIKFLTEHIVYNQKHKAKILDALIAALKDNSKEVRLESVVSLFKLFDLHKENGTNIIEVLIEITKDEDIWVKEYLAGALNKIDSKDEELFKAKWQVLLSLLVLHKDEEWILNESANSIGTYLNYINDKSILSEILNELFSYGFEADTLEHVRNNIKVQEVAALFEIYFQIVCGDANSVNDSLTVYLKGNYDTLTDTQLNHFVNKVKSAAEIFNQINLDDIIDDQLIVKFAGFLNNQNIPFKDLLNNLNNYFNEINISEKIVYLNLAAESIADLNNQKGQLNNLDRRLFDITIEEHINGLISKTSRLLLDNVYLDIELENREITLNELGVANINFSLINKGYKTVEDIYVSVKQSSYFEIIENIDSVGDLVKGQKKLQFFKIKPKTIGVLDIFTELTYRGCNKSILEQIRVYIKDAVKKEWVVIPNPYTSGIPIENDEVFVGRESLIQEAVTALKKDPVFVMGHRRMGKTSFIKYIQRHYLSGEDYIPVFISAEKVVFNNINEFLFSFCKPIANELYRKGIITKEQLKEYTDAIRKNGLIDFGVFLDDVLMEVEMADKILVLIIDEYPLIHEAVEQGKIDGQFISNLRGYMQNNSKEFKMIYSGASALKYLKSQYSSNIMGVGKSLEVSFLDVEDVRKLISQPLNDQMQLEDSAFQYLMEITNGQPFLVQVCLSFLVDKLNKEKKSSMVFKESLEEGISYFLEQAPHLQDDWNNRVYSNDLKWNDEEEKIAKAYKQLIITAISDQWKRNKNGVTKSDLFNTIENAMKEFHAVNKSIFDETLNLLAGTDDVLSLKNNMYFFKVGLFRDWVINKMNLTFSNTLLETKNNLI